jgi:thiosulfate dehydrogenase [quinone] large subunit
MWDQDTTVLTPPGDPEPSRRVEPTRSLLVLRLFLGATFTFAGLHKLYDPGFLAGTSSESVQRQAAALHGTGPVAELLGLAGTHAVALGMVVAFGELAVGIGTLLGLWTRLAATGGFLLSLTFFLTVGWRVRPYYYGSDIVFLFAWTPFLLGGVGGMPSVDAWLAARAARRLPPDSPASLVSRRALLYTSWLTGVVAGSALLLGAGVGRLGRARQRPAPPATPNPPTGASTGRATGPATDASTGRATGLGSSTPPVGGAVLMTDPSSGDPIYVAQPAPGQVVAFRAICTHAGCQVTFTPQAKCFTCPCHGATFDMSTGAVLGGPAPAPLPRASVPKTS